LDHLGLLATLVALVIRVTKAPKEEMVLLEAKVKEEKMDCKEKGDQLGQEDSGEGLVEGEA